MHDPTGLLVGSVAVSAPHAHFQHRRGDTERELRATAARLGRLSRAVQGQPAERWEGTTGRLPRAERTADAVIAQVDASLWHRLALMSGLEALDARAGGDFAGLDDEAATALLEGSPTPSSSCSSAGSRS